jgi:cytochrome c-type biogenesis protein CcmH/NrfG
MEAKGESLEEIPAAQQFLDNMWLLLVVSLLILAVSYVAWGLWEALSVPSI